MPNHHSSVRLHNPKEISLSTIEDILKSKTSIQLTEALVLYLREKIYFFRTPNKDLVSRRNQFQKTYKTFFENTQRIEQYVTLDDLIGDIQESQNKDQKLNLTKRLIKKFIEQYRPQDTPLGEYREYCKSLDKTTLQEHVKMFCYQQEENIILKKMFDIQPIIAIIARNIEQNAHKNLELSWFLEHIQRVENIIQSIENVFISFTRNIPKKEILTQKFLENWKQDIELIIMECFNLSTRFAILVDQKKEQDTSVYMESTQFRFAPSRRSSIIEELNNLKNNYPNIFNEQNFVELKNIHNTVNSFDHIVRLPTPVSILDAHEFLKYFEEYWEQLEHELQLPLKMNNTPYLSIGNFGKILLRPIPEEGKQARIAIRPNNNNFQGTNIRIDKAGEKLGFDFVGISYDQALSCLHDIGNQSLDRTVCLQYRNVVTQKGKIGIKGSKKMHSYYPSISQQAFESRASSAGERIALFCSAIGNMGIASRMRNLHSKFSYHFYGENSEKCMSDNFEHIVTTIKKALTNNFIDADSCSSLGDPSHQSQDPLLLDQPLTGNNQEAEL